MQKVYLLSTLVICPLVLGGCDTFRNTFGLDHYSPDAWTTEPSPALILPPDFASRPKLPPPKPGAPNPHVVSETVKAKKTVLGTSAPNVEAEPTVANSEKDIVNQASDGHEATPDIRKIVDEESQTDSTVSGKVISKIKSWKKEAQENLTMSKPEPEKQKLDKDTEDANNSEVD